MISVVRNMLGRRGVGGDRIDLPKNGPLGKPKSLSAKYTNLSAEYKSCSSFSDRFCIEQSIVFHAHNK